jgi:hypothetical protein
MKKTLTLIVLLQLGIITGATENFTRDGINIIATKENIVNSRVEN